MSMLVSFDNSDGRRRVATDASDLVWVVRVLSNREKDGLYLGPAGRSRAAMKNAERKKKHAQVHFAGSKRKR